MNRGDVVYDAIISKVASEVNLPVTVVDKVYKAYWKAIRKHIVSQPLKEDLTEEEFAKLRPNVNIPSIGKLYVTYDRYKRMKKQYQLVRNLKNNNTDAQNQETNPAV